MKNKNSGSYSQENDIPGKISDGIGIVRPPVPPSQAELYRSSIPEGQDDLIQTQELYYEEVPTKTRANNDEDYNDASDHIGAFKMVPDIENISSSGQPGPTSRNGDPQIHFLEAQEIQNQETDRSITGEVDTTHRDESYGGAGRFRVGHLQFLGQQPRSIPQEGKLADRKRAEAFEYAVRNAENSLYSSEAPAILQQTLLISPQHDFAPTNLNVFIDSMEARQNNNQRNHRRNITEIGTNDYGLQHRHEEEQYRSHKEIHGDLKQPSCNSIPDVIIEQDNSKPQANYNTESKPPRPPMQPDPASLLSKSEKRILRPTDWHQDNNRGEIYLALEQSTNFHDLSAFHQDIQKDQRYQIQVFEPSPTRIQAYRWQEFQNAPPLTGQPSAQQTASERVSGREGRAKECVSEALGQQNTRGVELQRNIEHFGPNSIAQHLMQSNEILQSKIKAHAIREQLFNQEIEILKEEVRRGREEKERMKAEWERERKVMEAKAIEKDRELVLAKKQNEHLRGSSEQQLTKLKQLKQQLQTVKSSHDMLKSDTNSMIREKLAALSSEMHQEFSDQILNLRSKLGNPQAHLDQPGSKSPSGLQLETVVNQMKAQLFQKDLQLDNLQVDHQRLVEQHETLAVENQAQLQQLERYKKDLQAVENLRQEVQVKMKELEQEQTQNEKIIYEKINQNELLKEQVQLFEQTVEELHFQVWNLDQQKGTKDNNHNYYQGRQFQDKQQNNLNENSGALDRKLHDLSRESDTNSDSKAACDQNSNPYGGGRTQQPTFPPREHLEPRVKGDGPSSADNGQRARNRLNRTFKTITEAVGEEDEETMGGPVQPKGEAPTGRDEELHTNKLSPQQNIDNNKEQPPQRSSQRKYQQDLEDLRAKFENIVRNSTNVDEINDDIRRIHGGPESNDHTASMLLEHYQQLEKEQNQDSFQRNRSMSEYIPDYLYAKAINKSYESLKALEQIAISRTATADSYHRIVPDQSHNNSELPDQNRQRALQASKLTVGNQILQLKDLLDLGESDKDKTDFLEHSSEKDEHKRKDIENRQHSASQHITPGLRQRSPLLMKEPGSRESKKSQKLDPQGIAQHLRAGANTGDQSATVQEFSAGSQNQSNLSENQKQPPSGGLDGTNGKKQNDKMFQYAKIGEPTKEKQRSEEASWNDIDSDESPGLYFRNRTSGSGDQDQVAKNKNWFSNPAEKPVPSDQPSTDSGNNIQAPPMKIPSESLPGEEGPENVGEIRGYINDTGSPESHLPQVTPQKRSFNLVQRAEEIKQSPYDPSIAENPHSSPRREPTFRRQIKDTNQYSTLLPIDPSEEFRSSERLARSPRSSMIEGSELASETHLVTITERTNEESMQSEVSQISFSQMLVNDLKQMIQRNGAKNKPNIHSQFSGQQMGNLADLGGPRSRVGQMWTSQITGIDIRKTTAARGQAPATKIPRDLIETQKAEFPKSKLSTQNVKIANQKIEDFCTDFDVDEEADEKTQSDENQHAIGNQPSSENSSRAFQQRRPMQKQSVYFASGHGDVESSVTEQVHSPMITPMQLMSIAAQANSGSSRGVSTRQNQNQQFIQNLSMSQSQQSASRLLNQSSHHHQQEQNSWQDEGSHPSLSRQGSRRNIKSGWQNGRRPVQNHMPLSDERDGSAQDRSYEALETEYNGYANMVPEEDVSYSEDGTRDRNEPPSSIQSSKRNSGKQHGIYN